MLKIFSCSFFGHRDFIQHSHYEMRLTEIIQYLIVNNDYVEFLVGNYGEFDRFVSSVIRKAKKNYYSNNCSHILVLPYPTAEYMNNQHYFHEFYDEVEICKESSISHFKSSIQTRNHCVIDRSDIIICCLERNEGGAYKSVEYAKRHNKKIINLADMSVNL